MPTAFEPSVYAAVVTAFALAGGAGPWWTTSLPVAEGARILAVEPIGGKSHWNFVSGIVRALVDRGHHVTAFTPFPGGNIGLADSSNYTEVDSSGAALMIVDTDLDDMLRLFGDPVNEVGPSVAISRRVCDAIYGHPEMRRLLREEPVGGGGGFDAVLAEPVLSGCLSQVARRTRSPLIYAMPGSHVSSGGRAFTGGFPHPAVESHHTARHARPVTFARRLSNALAYAYWELAWAYHETALARADPRDYDRAEPVPPSLVFVNGHFASDAPHAVPAEVVRVGGVHLRPADPLPEDILEFIENSPHGVICFTLGSTIRMSTLPKNLKKVFFEALAQIPQRVLMKYDIDIDDKPKNVMTLKWLPQRDILLHPNVKLFISHGGISGLYEAVDAGVPMLGFPLFGDQYKNIENLVNGGMAISMDFSTLTKEIFLNNVLEMLTNETYTRNAKTASDLFKDRPLSPAQQVVYWTEYVIRHKGALHLKSRANNLTWYQYYLLDAIAVVLIIISVVFFITYKVINSIIIFVVKYVTNFKTKSG